MINEKKYNYTFTIIAIVYMFFNGIFLPEGLLYTTLLAPLMFLFLLRKNEIKIFVVCFFISLFYLLIHWKTIDFPLSYFKSFILMQCVVIFIITAYNSIKKHIDSTKVFKVLATVNLILLILSFIVLFIPSIANSMWYKVPISPGIPIIPRLKMFTYEASYYSLIIVPVFAYYFFKFWLENKKVGILLISLLLSLIVSFSLGVIGGLVFAFIILFFSNFAQLYKKVNWNYVFVGLFGLIGALIILYFLLPDNPLYQRIENIIAGKDTSARGRTYEAFDIAYNIAKMKSIFWGIGLGQLKEIGRDYIIQYYNYSNIPATVRIPNAVAETINIFGISGLIIRFSLIFYLFFKTKVWTNYYRLFLFLFIFIYQFTGSFIFNVAEYIIWCLAFSSTILKSFDIQNKRFVELKNE